VQPPLVFSKSESVPLGFSNKLLRKAAYGCGILSYVLTGFSGMKDQNRWRIASGFGAAGINLTSLVVKERDDPLPDASIPHQMGHALLHPGENALFFNRAASFVADVLKLPAGFQSGKRAETMEGLWKTGVKLIDIAGLSDQDRREKEALKVPGISDTKEEVSPLHQIFANRWVSLSSSAIAAGLQVGQSIEKKKDKRMLASAIFYFLAVACQATDNAIMESKIRKVRDRER